jgi:hypothetical protein
MQHGFFIGSPAVDERDFVALTIQQQKHDYYDDRRQASESQDIVPQFVEGQRFAAPAIETRRRVAGAGIC